MPRACWRPGRAAAADTVADRVFGAGLLGGITSPALLRYHYEMRGTTLKEPFGSQVAMDVREVAQDGQKKVWVDMFEGPNHRALGPIDAREQNPLVLVFLQRDVAQMGGLTGGASGYFQQQIRRAFGKPAEVSQVTIELEGRPVQATRVVMHPFRDDPAIERFPRFRDKAVRVRRRTRGAGRALPDRREHARRRPATPCSRKA